MLMKAGRRAGRAAHDLSAPALRRQRRRAAQPRGRGWGQEALGLPIHDNWWQTETGGIMIANFAGDGHPARLDGPAAARRRGGDRGPRRGRPGPVGEAGRRRRPGRRGRAGPAAGLALDVPRLPATRRSATASCFAGGWYLTGDLARRDADGYYWFVGRATTSSSPPAT